MKKHLLILGILTLVGTLCSSTARADGDGYNPNGYPWNSPILTGDPQYNPDIRRPGPYTPKPKPASSSASPSNVIQISEVLTGTLTLSIEDMESGATMTIGVMAGDCFTLPQSEDGYILELYQNGKRIDSKML